MEAGKDAALIAVEIPRGVDDIAEYLVSGIDPAQVRWAAGHDTVVRDEQWWNE